MTSVETYILSRIPGIAPGLLDQGITQLRLERPIINDWPSNLDIRELQTQKAYEDILRSHIEMLERFQYHRNVVCETAEVPPNDATVL